MRKTIVMLFGVLVAGVASAATCPNPNCGAEVSSTAKCCKFCGRLLQAAPSPSPRAPIPAPRPTYSPPKPTYTPPKPTYTPPPTYTPQSQYNYTPSGARGWTPIRIGLAGPAGIPPGRWDVCGLNLSIIGGMSNTAYGISVGTIGDEGHALVGFSGGLFSTFEEVYGVQAAALCNIATRKFRGIQIGLANSAPTDSIGVQIGVFNTIGRGENSLTLPIVNMRF